MIRLGKCFQWLGFLGIFIGAALACFQLWRLASIGIFDIYVISSGFFVLVLFALPSLLVFGIGRFFEAMGR
ncbi:MAG: hypothetical protein NUV34_09615 [Sulfuricaulis sp.]|nr:hypothetical protein [Sulfuricaulis sp.]